MGHRIVHWFQAATMLVAFAGAVPAPDQAEQSRFLVEPIAERIVARLPEGPLFWRIETFPSPAAARNAAGCFSLSAEHDGRSWRFTLGPAGGSTPGATPIAEIGPVPFAPANRYLLRANRAG